MCEFGNVVEKRGYSYVEWTIEDCTSQLEGTGEDFYSPDFFFLNVPWYLQLLRDGTASDDSTGWIGLYLFLGRTEEESKSDCGKIAVCFTLGLKARDGTLYKSQTTTHSFAGPEKQYGWSKLVEREEILREKDKLWPDNVMTVSCEIRRVGERGIDAVSQTPSQSDFAVLSQDFKNLFSSGENADVTIKVKNSIFKVHSQILAARSAVFRSMFKHEMKEKNTGTIDIPDCDPGAFKVLLMFLYSGQSDDLSAENVMHLYTAADKYNILDLKKNCVDFMCQNISEEEVVDHLSLAIMHDDRELLAYGTEFFLKNAEKLFHTVKWLSFLEEHRIEANELIIKAFRYLSVK